MGFVEGSCTLYVPKEAVFHKQNGTSKPSYIKYGVFTVGGHDWEIQVYPDGAGTLKLNLNLLSATDTEVSRTELWLSPDYSSTENDYSENIHKPNVPKEIDSVTIEPSNKNDSVFIKLVLTVFAKDKPAKPDNQWNPNNADISFDASSNKPISKPGNPSGAWDPSNASISFDNKPILKPDNPTGAWDPSKASISFDDAK